MRDAVRKRKRSDQPSQAGTSGCVNTPTSVITGESVPTVAAQAIVPPDPTIGQPGTPGAVTVIVNVNVTIP